VDCFRSLQNQFAAFDNAWSGDKHQRTVAANENCAYRYGFWGIHRATDVCMMQNIRKNGRTIKDAHLIQNLASTTLLPYFRGGKYLMTLHAYAKINIGLHILGKRPDGYHDLETIFREVDLFDEIDIGPHKTLEMNADSILVPIDESNLCLKAAAILQKEKKIKEGVMIQLRKKIPIGAGLGGGSSDAAAILRGLNELWKLKLSNDQLRAVAVQVGSDVPFFIEGGNAFASGRGEILDHFSLDMPYWIVLVTPLIHISTLWAYAHLKLQRDGKGSELREKIAKQISSPKKLSSIAQNDFEQSTIEVYPEIGRIKDQLKDKGAVFSLMSGSGSSVFGFFESEKKASGAHSSFPKNYQTSLTAPTFKPER
jgi:4-diphosphocytidyl-2-C-methyl-D-erythritol kinase